MKEKEAVLLSLSSKRLTDEEQANWPIRQELQADWSSRRRNEMRGGRREDITRSSKVNSRTGAFGTDGWR